MESRARIPRKRQHFPNRTRVGIQLSFFFSFIVFFFYSGGKGDNFDCFTAEKIYNEIKKKKYLLQGTKTYFKFIPFFLSLRRKIILFTIYNTVLVSK